MATQEDPRMRSVNHAQGTTSTHACKRSGDEIAPLCRSVQAFVTKAKSCIVAVSISLTLYAAAGRSFGTKTRVTENG